MEPIIYLDNSATTKPCHTAIKYINEALCENWGNPSSLHMLGIIAEEKTELVRAKTASLIGAQPSEVFFTSGGTEANNIAIIGAVNARKKRGNRIITTAIEHPSVKEVMNHLEKEGFEVVYLKPNNNGVISKADIYNAINSETILVSIMLVNNEIGSIQPISVAADAIKQANAPALLHTDAVQAFGKMPIDVKALGVDFLTASGHKIHGPKGIGFLYKKKNVHITSNVFGGGQESGVRSGTHPTPNIMGLGGALEELPNLKAQLEKQSELWKYAKAKLESTGLVSINSKETCLPFILNISVNGYKSETILHFLEAKNIFVSSGSACAKGKKSYVLECCGLNDRQIDSSIRISFSRYNTCADIDKLCAEIISACKIIRKAY